MKKITLLDIKEALQDARFRQKLPNDLTPLVSQFLSNPNCACNVPLYRKILSGHKELLKEFFPGAEVEEIKEQKMENHWKVINCEASELENQLKNLNPGRKQVAVARWENQVTVVVNELDF